MGAESLQTFRTALFWVIT